MCFWIGFACGAFFVAVPFYTYRRRMLELLKEVRKPCNPT